MLEVERAEYSIFRKSLVISGIPMVRYWNARKRVNLIIPY